MDSNEEREGPGTFSEWQERALFADVVTVGQRPGCRVPSKVTRLSEVRVTRKADPGAALNPEAGLGLRVNCPQDSRPPDSPLARASDS
jgi:hypothetical protein